MVHLMGTWSIKINDFDVVTPTKKYTLDLIYGCTILEGKLSLHEKKPKFNILLASLKDN